MIIYDFNWVFMLKKIGYIWKKIIFAALKNQLE